MAKGHFSNKVIDKATLTGEIQALRDAFCDEIPIRIEDVDRSCNSLRATTADRENREYDHVITTVHSLSGSAATFGFEALAVVCKDFERDLVNWRHQERRVEAEEIQILDFHIVSMRRAFEKDTNTVEEAQPRGCDLPECRNEDGQDQLVFLVEDNQKQLRELELQLQYYGYEVEAFDNLEAFRERLRFKKPSMIVMDIIFPEGGLAGVEAIRDIQDQHQSIPVIFISARDDLRARLMAVRAGGEAYLTKPIEINRLIDLVDELTENEPLEPYRILLVEDDETVAQHYRACLERARMRVEVISNPGRVLDKLIEFIPDLVILDYYLPGCTGLELAKVIRQQHKFVSVPIVFLSTETDVTFQMEALNAGADDFLLKPASGTRLVSSIMARIRRARILKSFMVHDSLTGLFNHSAIIEKLGVEIARAMRRNEPMAFAMIDLDNFKQVNDRYGHMTGDRVLKNLARILKQRLRKSDLIGRYGGEEFAIIMPETSAIEAVKVMDEIRANFACLIHEANESTFTVTFSCGISDYPTYKDVNTLCEAADNVLYEAKDRGRNRTILDPKVKA
jgi:diguanylate cyclase (GGDEF)-like protein